MPKLSQQAKENIAWGAGAFILLLIILRKKAQAQQTDSQPSPITVLPGQTSAPDPAQDPAPVPNPLFIKGEQAVKDAIEQQQQEDPAHDLPDLSYYAGGPQKEYREDVVSDYMKDPYKDYGDLMQIM